MVRTLYVFGYDIWENAAQMNNLAHGPFVNVHKQSQSHCRHNCWENGIRFYLQSKCTLLDLLFVGWESVDKFQGYDQAVWLWQCHNRNTFPGQHMVFYPKKPSWRWGTLLYPPQIKFWVEVYWNHHVYP